MTTKEKIILVGAGGHCRSCIDVVEQEGRFDVAGIVDNDETILDVLGYPRLGSDEDLAHLRIEFKHALVTVGQIHSSVTRVQLFKKLKEIGFDLPVIISPLSHVSRHAQVGEGTVVMHNVVVNSSAQIGANCILNTRCLIEHDAQVGDHSHISTGAILNGAAKVGASCFVGSGATVIQERALPDNSFVKAGQLVVTEKDYRITE